MTKPTKSIFDKSYIVEFQANAAGAKEWPQGMPSDVALSRDEATRKYRFIKVTIDALTEAPLDASIGAARLIQAFVDCAKAQQEHCPHCMIHLSNGIGHHMQEVNGKAVKHTQFEYECLACGEEFGPAISNLGDAMANASMGVAGSRPRLSTCEGPTKKVWRIADSMPKASRKDVMAECIAQGIAYGTARTQYQAWFKASQDINREDVRKPYEQA